MFLSLSWRVMAFFGVWVMGSLLIGWLMVSRESLRADLAQAQGDVVLCQADRASFAARVEEFEKVLREMEETGKAQTTKFFTLQKDNAPRIAAYEKTARAILGRDFSFAGQVDLGDSAALAECAAVRELLGVGR